MGIVQLLSVFVVMQGNAMIKLPEPEFTDASLEGCIKARRSVRSFEDKALDLNQISLLLWAAQGETDKEQGFRAAPSAGATYPLEIYLCSQDGVFHYLPKSHGIERSDTSDVRSRIVTAALNQKFIGDAGCIIVITAVFERTTWRYGRRGEMYVHMEAGHAAQNIHLQAVALGLGSVPVGAFKEDDVADILQLEDEKPLYIIPVGYPKK
jgi:SagB-type dehydrogenase family enzyme